MLPNEANLFANEGSLVRNVMAVPASLWFPDRFRKARKIIFAFRSRISKKLVVAIWMCKASKTFKLSDVLGLELSEVVYEPNALIPVHEHEEAIFYLSLYGESSELIRNRSREFRQFTVGFLPPNYYHSIQSHSCTVHWFCVKIPQETLKNFSEHFTSGFESVYSHGGILAEILLRIRKEYHHPDSLSSLVSEALTQELLAEAYRKNLLFEKIPPKWLLRARDHLEANFREELKLETIASIVDMHPVHVAREFRKHFNFTVGEYVRNKRIDYACTQLGFSDAPVADIALASGFCDQSHLTRVFKRTIGITPSAYRAMRYDPRYSFDIDL